jgi:hypothetical protein
MSGNTRYAENVVVSLLVFPHLHYNADTRPSLAVLTYIYLVARPSLCS